MVPKFWVGTWRLRGAHLLWWGTHEQRGRHHLVSACRAAGRRSVLLRSEVRERDTCTCVCVNTHTLRYANPQGDTHSAFRTLAGSESMLNFFLWCFLIVFQSLQEKHHADKITVCVLVYVLYVLCVCVRVVCLYPKLLRDSKTGSEISERWQRTVRRSVIHQSNTDTPALSHNAAGHCHTY